MERQRNVSKRELVKREFQVSAERVCTDLESSLFQNNLKSEFILSSEFYVHNHRFLPRTLDKNV